MHQPEPFIGFDDNIELVKMSLVSGEYLDDAKLLSKQTNISLDRTKALRKTVKVDRKRCIPEASSCMMNRTGEAPCCLRCQICG